MNPGLNMKKILQEIGYSLGYDGDLSVEMLDESNFCRNPFSEYSLGPWCLIKDNKQNISIGQGNVPMCSEPAVGVYNECKTDRKGLTYQGKLNITHHGHSCLPWAYVYSLYIDSNN